MSTTNQFDKTKEETPTSRSRRTEVMTQTEKTRVTSNRSETIGQRSKVPVVRNSSNKESDQVAQQKQNQPKSQSRELRRKSSASAEKEMTETLAQTRRQQKKKQKEEKRKNKKPRLRIFPIWLRIVIVGVLSVAALFVGLMIGYGGLGDGEPSDALKWETWQHIIDIIFKEE